MVALLEVERPASVMQGELDADVELLRRLAGGDQRAFERLWWLHAAAVHGYLRAICDDEAVAEELLQDTFIAVWKAARSFQGRSRLRTWLFGIARRRARDRRRSPTLDLGGETLLDDHPASGATTEDQALARLELHELAAQIRRLRPLHREILALAFSHQLSHVEIAALLGIPLGTVKSRLDAARKALLGSLP